MLAYIGYETIIFCFHISFLNSKPVCHLLLASCNYFLQLIILIFLLSVCIWFLLVSVQTAFLRFKSLTILMSLHILPCWTRLKSCALYDSHMVAVWAKQPLVHLNSFYYQILEPYASIVRANVLLAAALYQFA